MNTTNKLGGRGQCDECGEWYDNVSFHTCPENKKGWLRETLDDIKNSKNKTYSYRDMMECWVEGRKNLVEWGVGEGDKPDFSSWM